MTGELMGAHVLVTTLGSSSLIFAVAFPNEREESVIDGMNRAFRFYGGLPKYMKPDNAKTFVVKNKNAEIVLNSTFADLERYYDTPVRPARPLRPRDKGAVESAVRYVEERVLSQMKNEIYGSFDEFNRELMRRVEALNERENKQTGQSRRQVFELLDKPALRPLPSGYFSPYESRIVKVQSNYHVQLDGFYYSVPCQLYVKGKTTEVIIKANSQEVLICDLDNILICRHQRRFNLKDGKYVTNPDHRPAAHSYAAQEMQDTVESILFTARKCGPEVYQFIDALLNKTDFKEHQFKACRGCLNLCKKTPWELSNKAARECLDAGIITYGSFKNTLKRVQSEDGDQKHENLRGGGGFR